MEVGRVVDGCGEDAKVVLTFALTVELLPPFSEVVEFGVVVHEDFSFLSCLIESVAGFSIEECGVGSIRCVGHFLHFCSTVDERADVKSGNCDGEKTYGGEHGETATYVVGDDESLVAFLSGEATESAALCVGDGNDALAGFFNTELTFELLLEETECDGGFGSCTALRDYDDAETLVLEIVPRTSVSASS